MTQDDMVRIARECGIGLAYGRESIERFYTLVASAEREACAEIADKELDNTMLLTSYPPKSSAAWNIRAAIRARDKT
jgi:hypothetical protein